MPTSLVAVRASSWRLAVTGPSEDGAATVARLRSFVDSGATRPLEWRLERLSALREALLASEPELLDALASDLGKPAAESFLTDLALVVREIDNVRRNLGRWSRPTRVRIPLVQQLGRAEVRREPLGVVLVVAPWNYPVYLTLMPTVSALAAGNCVVVKPSELAPATGAVLARLLRSGMDDLGTAAILGGPEVVHELLDAGIDHVFFTGSTRVGRIIAEAAGRRLVPVTLELGGKCPAFVAADADLTSAARRIAWAKFVNAGQTCVAPDYVLVERAVADAFVAELASAVRTMFGVDPRTSAHYARIVDVAHLDRLAGLLEGHGGRIVVGGALDRRDRYLGPTIVRDPAPEGALMTEEIFGPILPVTAVEGVDQAIAVVCSKPDPLAVYAFVEDAGVATALREGTRSGSFCVNVAMAQLGIADLPFGGVGPSGTGVAHGRWGVESMSQLRAVLVRRSRPDLGLHLPPYTTLKSWLLRRALRVPAPGGSRIANRGRAEDPSSRTPRR